MALVDVFPKVCDGIIPVEGSIFYFSSFIGETLLSELVGLFIGCSLFYVRLDSFETSRITDYLIVSFYNTDAVELFPEGWLAALILIK